MKLNLRFLTMLSKIHFLLYSVIFSCFFSLLSTGKTEEFTNFISDMPCQCQIQHFTDVEDITEAEKIHVIYHAMNKLVQKQYTAGNVKRLYTQPLTIKKWEGWSRGDSLRIDIIQSFYSTFYWIDLRTRLDSISHYRILEGERYDRFQEMVLDVSEIPFKITKTEDYGTETESGILYYIE